VNDSGYRVGMLIAPIVITDNWDNWKGLYAELLEQLSDELSQKTKKQLFIEIIFMTYSYVHCAINRDAFPNAVTGCKHQRFRHVANPVPRYTKSPFKGRYYERMGKPRK